MILRKHAHKNDTVLTMPILGIVASRCLMNSHLYVAHPSLPLARTWCCFHFIQALFLLMFGTLSNIPYLK